MKNKKFDKTLFSNQKHGIATDNISEAGKNGREYHFAGTNASYLLGKSGRRLNRGRSRRIGHRKKPFTNNSFRDAEKYLKNTLVLTTEVK